MTHASKIREIYRIPFHWHFEIVAFYLLRFIGIAYKRGANKLRFYIHLINSKGRIIKTDDGFVTCKYNFRHRDLTITLRNFPSSDPEVFEQVFIFEEYSPVIKRIDSNRKKLTMIDAGANIGLTAIYFKVFFNDVEVFAVEPDPENFRLLVKNLESNQMSAQGCINSALWNTSAPLKTASAFRDGRSWSVTVAEVAELNSELRGVTLVELFQQFNLESLDVLKVDIEGAEKYVFQDYEGVAEVLKKTKHLAIEIHDEVSDREAIESVLINAGIRISHHGELTIGENERL